MGLRVGVWSTCDNMMGDQPRCVCSHTGLPLRRLDYHDRRCSHRLCIPHYSMRPCPSAELSALCLFQSNRTWHRQVAGQLEPNTVTPPLECVHTTYPHCHMTSMWLSSYLLVSHAQRLEFLYHFQHPSPSSSCYPSNYLSANTPRHPCCLLRSPNESRG